jgi:hypothetical protein
MSNLFKVATIFIAAYAISTGAAAQKTVYRCGATYSQIPCEGAVSVDASDARSKADKAEADKATQRDMKQARDMEKTRLKEEKEALAEAKAAAKANAKSKTAKEPEADSKKKSASKKKEPEFFTAKTAPDSKKKD